MISLKYDRFVDLSVPVHGVHVESVHPFVSNTFEDEIFFLIGTGGPAPRVERENITFFERNRQIQLKVFKSLVQRNTVVDFGKILRAYVDDLKIGCDLKIDLGSCIKVLA